MQAPGSEAVTPSADDGPVQPASIRRSIVSFKHSVARAYWWSLHDIDETDFDNLFTFVTFKPDGEQADPDIRIIDGNISRRVQGAPSWL